MKKEWLSVMKRVLIGVAFGVAIIFAGALGISALIIYEVIDPEMSHIGACVVLLAASIVSAFTANSDNTAASVVRYLAGSTVLLVIILLGNLILNDGGPQNMIGTLLVVYAGGVTPCLLNTRRNKQVRGGRRITQMVNLYKKQGG